VPLPEQGRGFRIFPSFVKRDTHFGTKELIALISRAGKTVQSLHTNAIVGIGNLSREGGGKTGSSVSHKSGRDADIGMFALTKDGKARNLKSFVAFEKDGWDKKKRFQFDPKRNLDLVLALIEDGQVQVQVVFVADWLKARLVVEARHRGLESERITRLETILKQPSDSNPHHHHYHVRLYCSIDDRLHGCLERGDIHPWVDHGDSAFEERVQKLIGLLAMKETRWRRAAVVRLGEIKAKTALPHLVQRAEDSSAKVSQLALHALGQIADPSVYEPLQSLLFKTQNPKRLVEIIDAMLRIEQPELENTVLELLKRMDEGGLELSRTDSNVARLKVLEVLSRFGRKPAFERVYGFLMGNNKKLARAAHDTLRRITNQPITLRRSGRRSFLKVQRRWKAFREGHRKSTWLEWMRLGFEARGMRSVRMNLEHASRELLIKTLGHRDDDASHNAAMALMVLSDHIAYPWWRNKRNNQRHWRSWFRENPPNQGQD
jgi:penicillin-insensitive murein endopeptidase